MTTTTTTTKTLIGTNGHHQERRTGVLFVCSRDGPDCTCRGAGQLVWIQGVPNEVQSEVQQVVVVVVGIVNVGFPPGFSLCSEQMHVAQFDTTFWSICEVRQFLNLCTPQQITCATC